MQPRAGTNGTTGKGLCKFRRFNIVLLKDDPKNNEKNLFPGAFPTYIIGLIGSIVMGETAAEGRWVLTGIIFGIALILFLLGFIFRKKVQNWLEKISIRQKKSKPW